jgi:phosphoribosylformimino-5-aminoimidazole carboxamide ribotide isomerase
MRIIPAIDLIEGKCVRLSQGDYNSKKIYHEDPLAVAQSFEDAGLQYLHLVDLDGAKAGRVTNWKVIESITTHTALRVDFGGGVKTRDEIEKLLNFGIEQVNLGSIAIKDRLKVFDWISSFGSQKIILSADVKNEKIAISGWQEDSSVHITDLIQDYLDHGLQYVTCTDISTDGMLKGPNIELYQKLLRHFPAIKLVASGGVSEMADLAALKKIGVDGVIIGKAIYEGRIQIHELVTP